MNTTKHPDDYLTLTRPSERYTIVPTTADPDRYDDLNSAKRVELYDKLSRNLHNPKYRHQSRVHYDEFARFNRKFHELNYPCPPPPKHDDTLPGTQSLAASSRYKSMSSRSKSKSKYMSSYTMQQQQNQPIKTLKSQILEKASSGDFPEVEKIVAAIIRSLIQNGADPDQIQYAFQNIALKFVVNEETSEFEICLHL
ncbi:hypothetical protein TRFO_11740 [Tritrichomonas foetus]|uniref:Uncharacterized protein n=1 Tax=Tritrichomonas foetus TaxID=1144522 RepID=A0A1J4J798_9EUKA|nr:hypothetical protein TRFO_11740 [Tritrichomonas foetus]|eukprot:OHS93531.1 hypothetical protein TRFO_11740 [Tritrichomonas foetus]